MPDNQNAALSSEEELRQEVIRLKGELSAATSAISRLFILFRIIDKLADDSSADAMFPDMVSRFMRRGVSAEAIRELNETGIDPDIFIEGVDRFKERLSHHLSKSLSQYSTE